MRLTCLCVNLFYIDFRQTQDVIFGAHTQQLEESKSKAQDPKEYYFSFSDALEFLYFV